MMNRAPSHISAVIARFAAARTRQAWVSASFAAERMLTPTEQLAVVDAAKSARVRVGLAA